MCGMCFLLVDSLQSDLSLQESSYGPAKSSKFRYLAICQAGVIMAAALGIDITPSMNENADIQLRKLTKQRSRDLSFSSLNFNNRSRKSSNNDKLKSLTDSNSSVYGTYRKSSENESSRHIVVSSHPNLIDLDDISSPLRSYDIICDSEDYDPFSSPSQDSCTGRNSQTFRYSNPELDSLNRNLSRGSLQSPSHVLEEKPKRPDSLDLLKNEENKSYRKFFITPKLSSLANSSAFPNSSASSSSQSPASTPSPKTTYPPTRTPFSVNRKHTLLESEIERPGKRLPALLMDNNKRNDSKSKEDAVTFL